MFANVVVIRDIAWDQRSGRLVVLLNSRAVGGRDAIDLLDPLTGEIRRIPLERPAGGGDEPLSQLTIGHRYLWLRNHSGDGPTYRLDRRYLEQGESLVIPERLTTPDENDTGNAS